MAESEIRPAWKRGTDVVAGTAALVIALIPMGLIGLAIIAESGRPVLLKQRRIGIHGEEFGMWKFRTLPKDTPQVAKSELRASGLEPTRLGRFLRRYSLDELPQLLNIVGGDMSLIGPRPALFTQLDLTAMRREAGVLRVRPGLTGLAQIHGRENLALVQKVALDAEYVRRLSPMLDLSIVLRTASAVLGARGSY